MTWFPLPRAELGDRAEEESELEAVRAGRRNGDATWEGEEISDNR